MYVFNNSREPWAAAGLRTTIPQMLLLQSFTALSLVLLIPSTAVLVHSGPADSSSKDVHDGSLSPRGIPFVVLKLVIPSQILSFQMCPNQDQLTSLYLNPNQ